ncbi:hypothetical protein GCK72_004171 [Caenorhabditis remanei]|uniref:F-box domain-containing protein n=1 Tax=Caenorhabditis remanei TaxID=31234 RepID=A0A6A5HBP5_CAERE|nr:hypothetical protein GCK72_004171 [Caenorhabditis remanei]KAF1764224.1 hypothetical protein GCK72_004171 [Caenorhabditis remanei]
MYRSICSQMLCLKWFKSPPEEVSIMDMPDLVMRKILGNVDFLTIMKLRKVCHAFRNFIDDTKLDYGFNRVCFVFRPSLIRVVIYRSNPMVSSNTDPITLNYANRIILNYAKYATSSLVNITGWDRVKFLEEEDFLDVFSRDFKVILRNQRLGSMKLEIEENQDYDLLDSLFYKEFLKGNFTFISNKKYGWWSCRRNRLKSQWEFVDHLRDVNGEPLLKPSVDQFYDCFKTVLKSRGNLIRIEELYIEIMESYHFMDIARFIDMKHMKCLDIVRLDQSGFKKEQQFLDEIVELDGWECIQELTISNFHVTIPLERFLHKSHLNIQIPTISMEDVLLLKMRLLTSPVFEDYTIYSDDLKDMDRLISVLGRFQVDDDQEKHWYYRIPDTKQVLDIGHAHDYNHTYFSFFRSEISDVPKNAIIY